MYVFREIQFFPKSGDIEITATQTNTNYLLIFSRDCSNGKWPLPLSRDKATLLFHGDKVMVRAVACEFRFE
jgi:hypothetical protein